MTSLQLTFDNALKPPKRHARRREQGNVFQRPAFFFDFTDDWSFGRRSEPALSTIKKFSNQGFVADLDELAMLASRPLSGLEADFAWVAFAIYMADRYAARRPFGPNAVPFWRRRIHVRVPVRDRDRWLAAEESLIRALEFLTEDDWSFDFIGTRMPFSVETQGRFRDFVPPKVDWVSLFSGGLDSLAGALHWIQRVQKPGLLVSGQTHHRMERAQHLQISALRNAFPGRVEHCGVSYGLPEKLETSGIDSSQRTRSFVHVSLGILSSMLAGLRQLFLFENGVGALNLSCDHSQIGSQNSRGTHPVFLLRMSAFASSYFGDRFAVVNPFAFMTKGQMLEAATMDGFEDLLQSSFSCDRFPNYHHRASQCGHCPSCLIRRLSFQVSGRPDDFAGYSFNIFAPHLPPRDSEIFAFNKLSLQAEAIRVRMASKEPWHALSAMWPILILSDGEIANPGFREAVVGLLRQHATEWQDFRRAIGYQNLAHAA